MTTDGDKMLVLIWIQTVQHSDSVPDFFFFKLSRRQQKHAKLPRVKLVCAVTPPIDIGSQMRKKKNEKSEEGP